MPRQPIISELTGISPFVAGLPPSAPYQAPPAYFETLPERILDRIRTEKTLQDAPSLPALPDERKRPQKVPAGYFENLASELLVRVRALPREQTIQEELGELSPLLGGMPRKMPFSLPADYFSTLTASATAGELNGNPDNLSADELPAVLQNLHRIPAYQVPAGYFERFPDTMLREVAPRKAKVVSMQRSGIVRFAAAACVAAIAAVGGWFFFHTTTVPTGGKNEVAYIKNLSNQELQDFVDKNTVILPESIPAAVPPSGDIKDDDIRVMLAGVPDEELQKYLDQQPQPAANGGANYN